MIKPKKKNKGSIYLTLIGTREPIKNIRCTGVAISMYIDDVEELSKKTKSSGRVRRVFGYHMVTELIEAINESFKTREFFGEGMVNKMIRLLYEKEQTANKTENPKKERSL